LTDHPESAPRVGQVIAHGTLGCAGVVTGLTVLVATAVSSAGLSDDARQVLGFGFGGLPGGAGAGIEIAINNAQLASAALLGAALAPRAASLALLVDVLLGALLVLNAGFLGIAFGGYGDRLLTASWPHLPFELAAFSLAGGTYLAARARRLTGRALAAAAAAVGALLLAGGLVEATVSSPR
jgi:hypothetical protein